MSSQYISPFSKLHCLRHLGSSFALLQSLFIHNEAYIIGSGEIKGGGALYLTQNSAMSMLSTTFKNNTAGGVCFGGAIFLSSSSVDMTSCSFEANYAAVGGA